MREKNGNGERRTTTHTKRKEERTEWTRMKRKMIGERQKKSNTATE